MPRCLDREPGAAHRGRVVVLPGIRKVDPCQRGEIEPQRRVAAKDLSGSPKERAGLLGVAQDYLRGAAYASRIVLNPAAVRNTKVVHARGDLDMRRMVPLIHGRFGGVAVHPDSARVVVLDDARCLVDEQSTGLGQVAEASQHLPS